MKILSVTGQKPHSTGSGVYLAELVNNWYEQGHEQAVVAGIYREDSVNFREGVLFYPVYFRTEELPFAIAGMSDEMPYESLRYCDFSEEIFSRYQEVFAGILRKAVEEFQPDVIVCHHLYLLTALVREWYPDRKIIGLSHGSDLRQINKNPFRREYIKEQIRKLDGISALHMEQKEQIERIFGYDPDKIRSIGVGYNQNIFNKKNKAAWTEGDCCRLAFAGKVTEKKGIFSLLRALELLPYRAEQLVVTIAGGHGPEEEYEEIQKLAGACRYRIELTGRVDQTELAGIFRQSDVFVLPSFFEGLPLVNIEAMACGCRVVCTDIPGIKEWYDEKIPGHDIAFVPLPKMKNTDEPLAEELPEFERRLAEALQRKLEQTGWQQPSLEMVSWRGISAEILKLV